LILSDYLLKHPPFFDFFGIIYKKYSKQKNKKKQKKQKNNISPSPPNHFFKFEGVLPAISLLIDLNLYPPIP